MSDWDPTLYLRFDDERTRPALDLLARVPVAAARRVIDLGCGPGNSTAPLRRRWPAARVTGLDSSPAMLDEARRGDPGVAWVEGDVASWRPAPGAWDVIFANAVLHWVPAHLPLVAGWIAGLAPGGALAFQVPRPPQSAAHEALAELAASAAWRAHFADGPAAHWVAAPADYHAALAGAGATVVTWTTEYDHVLAGPAAAVAWITGTGLRPYLARLPDDAARARFSADLEALVAPRLPRLADGRVLFAFRRLFVVAVRAG